MARARDLSGARVTVMGLGRFGGGIGVTRYLVAQGADVLVTDLESREKLADSVAQITDLIESGRVTLRLGEHNVSDFTTCDLVVANPAVPRPWENRFLRSAEAAGVRITTEIQLAVDGIPPGARIAAITGSAGKSTTSALVHHVLNELGERVHFGGNIGGSLLARASDVRATDVVVLELSSFQLHWLREFRPGVAAVTNLEPNHLDWHVTLDHYRDSKRRVLQGQQPGSVAVLGAGVADWPTNAGVRRVIMPESAFIPGLLIPGAHNEVNAAMAIEICRAVVHTAGRELNERAAIAAAQTFQGLPHRLRHVGVHRGIRFYDDSKSTTPHATMLALDSFPAERAARRIHLIAGGYDKGQDLSPIAFAAPDLKGLYTVGTTGDWIAQAAGGSASGNRVIPCVTLERAMAAISERAEPGDIVLLSPGCASWDQFQNYEERGEQFVALVKEIFAAVGSQS